MSVESAPASWQNHRLRQVCECQRCERDGPQSSHHNDSHDQSLSQQFVVAGHSIVIRGGSTKCARVLARWLQDHFEELEISSKDVIEVGSGTGLVGLTLARLGARSVILTDQEPVLDIVQDSIENNFYNDEDKNVEAVALYWGDPIPAVLNDKFLIIGSDLIFAKENVRLLLKTFDELCRNPEQMILFAHIDRFSWENDFFTGMIELGFHTEQLFSDEDIDIFRFRRDNLSEIVSTK